MSCPGTDASGVWDRGQVITYSCSRADAGQYRLCANLYAAKYNWLVKRDGSPSEDELCTSCRLTRTRPTDADTEAPISNILTRPDERSGHFRQRIVRRRGSCLARVVGSRRRAR
jgi:hypothetical protein